jgi:hypothetical protein
MKLHSDSVTQKLEELEKTFFNLKSTSAKQIEDMKRDKARLE